jgi:hypothetical protein
LPTSHGQFLAIITIEKETFIYRNNNYKERIALKITMYGKGYIIRVSPSSLFTLTPSPSPPHPYFYTLTPAPL